MLIRTAGAIGAVVIASNVVMKLTINFKNLFAFFLFAMLMGEAHEIAHFVIGRALCGCWPTYRDFNAWQICDCSLGHWATAAGPVFSMSLAWMGMFMLRSERSNLQSLGFVLVWANVPQARLLTVYMGGGDETVVLRNLLLGTELHPYVHWFAYGVVTAMALPPILGVFYAVKNKWGWLYNVGFMILPLVVIGAYGFVFLNGLLEKGFLSKVWIMGTPVFITLHTVVVLILFLIFSRKYLFAFVHDNERRLPVLD